MDWWRQRPDCISLTKNRRRELESVSVTECVEEFCYKGEQRNRIVPSNSVGSIEDF